MVAVKQPELIRTLTLAEPALFSLLAEKPEGKPVLDEWNRGAEPMIAAIKAGDNVQATRHLSALVMGDSVEDFDKLPAAFRQMLLANTRTMPLLFAATPPSITCEMLRSLNMPTLAGARARLESFRRSTTKWASASAAAGWSSSRRHRTRCRSTTRLTSIAKSWPFCASRGLARSDVLGKLFHMMSGL
jgi:hypothetical protein